MALKKGKKYKETKKICFKFFAILGICHFEAYIRIRYFKPTRL